ncbi:MAG: hypothetical protein IT365_07920 [Candidatus Hydrogenedentes bacterium]|nr:hypothetical protein [Candidatus Hydrogenedentota bacterium]
MQPMEFWKHTALVLVLAGVLALNPGCASTKNVMNKATFGLVGGNAEDSANASDEQKRAAKEERKQQEAAEKQAKKDAKAPKKEQKRQEKEAAGERGFMSKATFGLVGGSEDKAAKKEAKRQAKEEKKADERAEEEQEKAEKQARKEEKAAKKGEERGLMSKATFGLVGGDSEEKAAKKEAKRQAKEEKKNAERAEEEQEKADKQARKQAKAEQEQAEKASEEADEPKSERGLMSKATFGLVGGDSEEKAAKKAAKRQAKEEKKAAERAEEDQEEADKQARKQAKAEAKQAEDASEEVEEPKSDRSFMSKATFGLVGGDSEEKTAKKEAKRQEKEEEKAAERAEEEQEEAEKQARKEEEAAQEAQQPEEKRGLMSKLTFGLVGGKGEDKAAEGAEETVAQEMPASTPEPPVAMPGADAQFDVQPASALSGDAQKLARLPFETAVSYDSTSAGGKPQAVASRSTYSKHGYGITDLGDVRIAVRDMEFNGGTKGGAIVISSEDRAKAGGRAGIGNETFNFDYAKGVTTCTFGTIQFTVQQGVLTIGGRSVPMGKGHKLVVLDAQGNVEGVYAIQ